MKENLRKTRFKAKQQLEHFRVFTSDPITRPDAAAGKANTNGKFKLFETPPNSNNSSSKLPVSATRKTSQEYDGSVEWPERGELHHHAMSTSIAFGDPKIDPGVGRVDPFGRLPINSRRVESLMDSCEFIQSFWNIWAPSNCSLDAARQATEPLFSVDNIGSYSLPAVFRLGLSDPAFFYALLFSIAFAANRGQMTTECLRYKGEAIRLLNRRITCPQSAVGETCIGTIMILTGVEYRMGNRSTHEMHMQGLAKILSLRDLSSGPLNEGIIRGLFWTDLFGAVILGSTRLFTHETFSELHWDRDPWGACDHPLPPGFQVNFHVLNDELLSTIEDIQALQASIQLSQSGERKPLSISQIDNIQASIESRLCSLQYTTQNLGPIQECCRLAAYICCYALFTEVWNSHTILNQLSTQLRGLLCQTYMQSCWNDCVDLLLWVLFIGGSFAEPAPLRSGYVQMLNESGFFVQRGVACDAWEEVEEILRMFIWSDKVFRRRCKSFWEEVYAHRQTS